MLEQELRRKKENKDWFEHDPLITTETIVQTTSIEELRRELNDDPDKLYQYFTDGEISYCKTRIASYSGRLAAKQAVFELIGQPVSWTDISIIPSPSEQPVVYLRGQALEIAAQKGIAAIPLSISHDSSVAVAFVMGVRDPLSTIALGIDIASRDRIKRLFSKHDGRFLRRIFSPAELEQAGGDPSRLTHMWAGKEAVTKALGTGVWTEGIAWTDISILERGDGKTVVDLKGPALLQAQKKDLHNFDIQLLRHEATPMAFVIGS